MSVLARDLCGTRSPVDPHDFVKGLVKTLRVEGARAYPLPESWISKAGLFKRGSERTVGSFNFSRFYGAMRYSCRTFLSRQISDPCKPFAFGY
jgi:hypothetical protein